MQLIQETCLANAQRRTLQNEAKEVKKQFQGEPTDPEQAKAAAGVGAMCVESLNMYPVPNPTMDYLDAAATGRCAIYCTDVSGVTMAVAAIYGWTGGTKGSPHAARTEDILTIVQMQFEPLQPGPKLIAGDLNGSPDAFDTITTLTAEYGWTHAGMVRKLRQSGTWAVYVPCRRNSQRKQN